MDNKPNGIQRFFNVFMKGMSTFQGCLSMIFSLLAILVSILVIFSNWATKNLSPDAIKNSTGIFSNYSTQQTQPSISLTATAMKISSTAFEENTQIPSQYTCDGQNQRPTLQIAEVPTEAKSLALIVHDPDAPAPGGFTHWVIWNIPPQTVEILGNSIPAGAVEGKIGSGKNAWTGPCPPSGNHHYQFTLFALDTSLDIPSTTDKTGLEKAIEGHILAQNMLTGLYQRK